MRSTLLATSRLYSNQRRLNRVPDKPGQADYDQRQVLHDGRTSSSACLFVYDTTAFTLTGTTWSGKLLLILRHGIYFG